MAVSPHNSRQPNQLRSSWFGLVGTALILLSIIIIGYTVKKAFYPDVEAQLPIQIQEAIAESVMGTTTKKAVKKAPAKKAPQSTLSIPSLRIKANIEDTGITVHGTIGSPTTYTTVAMYRYGADPGEQGLVIMGGHVNNGFNLAGVFQNLKSISAGDEIIITNPKGKKVVYVARQTLTLDHNAGINEIYALHDPNKAQLVLITCEGTWLPDQKTYDHRIIVLADLK